MKEQIDIPSKKKIRQAGDILRNPDSSREDFSFAMVTLSKWRQLQQETLQILKKRILTTFWIQKSFLTSSQKSNRS